MVLAMFFHPHHFVTNCCIVSCSLPGVCAGRRLTTWDGAKLGRPGGRLPATSPVPPASGGGHARLRPAARVVPSPAAVRQGTHDDWGLPSGPIGGGHPNELRDLDAQLVTSPAVTLPSAWCRVIHHLSLLLKRLYTDGDSESWVGFVWLQLTAMIAHTWAHFSLPSAQLLPQRWLAL